jgi:coenzyme F420-reducing hydrogenase delta subunit
MGLRPLPRLPPLFVDDRHAADLAGLYRGIGGYWIVWDQLAQLSPVATTELLDWLPIFSEPSARNFLAPDSINDRFFTVLVFIHIGVPLLLILGLWAHVHRISHVDYLPSRRVMLATAGRLPAAGAAQAGAQQPAGQSGPGTPADSPRLVHPVPPSADRLSSPALVWSLLFGATDPALRAAFPAAPQASRSPSSTRPTATAAPLPGRLPLRRDHHGAAPGQAGFQLAVVDADLCAGCGICAGSCPSSTPFRSRETLVTGIDMPQLPVNALREQLEGRTRIVIFACTRGAEAGPLAAVDTAVIGLICTGMLPPAFVEYALRGGADGVLVATCRSGGCEFRLGDLWTSQRLLGQREPHLRRTVPPSRLQLLAASAHDDRTLAEVLAEFRTRLEALPVASDRLPPYLRSASHHA